MFNNFSILAELIEVPPRKASAYLMDLSKVYRYTLTHLEHRTVRVQEELDFLDRYLALLKERFLIPGRADEYLVVPSSDVSHITSRTGW